MRKKVSFLLLLLIAMASIAVAQVKVSGVITDMDQNAIPGATILEKGTTNGTITDMDGNYTITVSSANATLRFSFVGMLS